MRFPVTQFLRASGSAWARSAGPGVVRAGMVRAGVVRAGLTRAGLAGIPGARSRVVLDDSVVAPIAGVAGPGVERAWAAVAVVLDLAGVVVADVLGLVVVTGGVVVLRLVPVPILDVVRVVLRHLGRRAAGIGGVLGLVAGALHVDGGRGGRRRVALGRGRRDICGAADEHGGRNGQQRLGQS